MEITKSAYQNYLNYLSRETDFSGDIESDIASRFVHSTDNSIYQKIAGAIIYPRNKLDIQIAVKVSQQFPEIFFSAKGGGTGTNGQSLTEGIIIDCKRYLNNLLEIDINNGYIEVESGIVLSRLNELLKPKNHFFPVDISPYDRATIGGMIATDACGKGSYHHGRMGDNILEIEYVDYAGEIQIINESAYPEILESIANLTQKNQVEITNAFPDHIRYATGYNLKKILETKNFNYLFAGSEGTLGIIISAKLKIQKTIPCRAVIVNFYLDFNSSIRDVTNIMKQDPFSIEVMDETLLELAKADETTKDIQQEIYAGGKVNAISLIEFNACDEAGLNKKLTEFESSHKQLVSNDYKIIKNDAQIRDLYLLRKNAVGIVANLDPKKRPIAFIEDVAIPIKSLLDYIQDLKALLESHKLRYVIYGHADVGLVHVRPALDLELLEDKRIFQQLSLEVISLVKKYDGVMWGEHSCGFRSSIADKYYGSGIIDIFENIKQICDPLNIFNPGKIVANNLRQTIEFDQDLHADFNKEITADLKQEYSSSLLCNGNAKCLSNQDDQLMCPTYKITKDLKQSPKGRSNLIRLWLNFISRNPVPNESNKQKAYANANKPFFDKIYNSLNSCLSCTACSSSCPVKVDIPKHKAKFMGFYYSIYRKKLQVKLLENLEVILCKLYQIRTISFPLLRINITKRLFEKIFDLSNINNKVKVSTIAKVSSTRKGKKYIFSDIATTLYTPEIIESASNILNKLDITHEVLEPLPSAMGYEHFGNESKLQKYKNLLTEKLSAADMIIIIDPAIYNFFQRHLSEQINSISFIDLIHSHKDKIPTSTTKQEKVNFYGHCIGNSMHQNQAKKWQEIFEHVNCEFQNISQNCCGMAGFYGYQKENYDNSKKLYQTNVKPKQNQNIVFDGISCFSQNNRLGENETLHIICKLNSLMPCPTNTRSL